MHDPSQLSACRPQYHLHACPLRGDYYFIGKEFFQPSSDEMESGERFAYEGANFMRVSFLLKSSWATYLVA
jgi:hypothetical protein